MVVGKILIDLWQFWAHGRCLLKRHHLQFKKIGFILKVSLEKIFSTWQKIQYALMVSLEETPSTI